MLDLSQTKPDYKIVINDKEELLLFLIQEVENSFKGISVDQAGITRFFNGNKKFQVFSFFMYKEILDSCDIKDGTHYAFPLKEGGNFEGYGEASYSFQRVPCKIEKII